MGYSKKYYQKNRREILERQKFHYWRNPKRYRKYCQEYKKKNKTKIKRYKEEYKKTPGGIWTNLNRKHARKISKKDFIQWYLKQPKKCIYCGVKEINLNERLQIDRKNHNQEYEKENLALACKLCNWIKGLYFTYEEMIKIGEVIRGIRKSRSTQLDTERHKRNNIF